MPKNFCSGEGRSSGRLLPWENGVFLNVCIIRYCLRWLKRGKGKQCTLICVILLVINSRLWNQCAFLRALGSPVKSCYADEETEAWRFSCRFTEGSWGVLGCCSPISILMSLMLWFAALCRGFSVGLSRARVPCPAHLPSGPSPPENPMCRAGSAALLMNWGKYQPAGALWLTWGPKLQTPLSFALLFLCGEVLCPQLPGLGRVSCGWWDLQRLLLQRCTKHSCQVKKMSDGRRSFALWMWYNQVLIKAVAVDY